MQYWLDLFTAKTWQEFLFNGGDVSGFRPNRWTTVQQIKPGDRLICYLTGISRFVGILEVTSKGFQDETPIWSRETFPSRVRVRTVIALNPDTGVPIVALKEQLT